MQVDRSFWQNKRVLLTGHTGFKGAWLALWLTQLGAKVVGFALPPAQDNSLFETLDLARRCTHVVGDIRDQAQLLAVMRTHEVEIVFHLAAQALVRPSYHDPVETYDVNVMGSLKLLECVRQCASVRSVVMVTTDKCYENKEWYWAYREIDPIGGHDPYSSSKGAMELMVASYRASFFPPDQHAVHGKAVATARAGNVIGGGDWAVDRLLPDLVRAFAASEPVVIRHAHAIRPWQHVLQPLRGYLLLAERLWTAGSGHAEAWNFGPLENDCLPVGVLAQRVAQLWGGECEVRDQTDPLAPHEAHFLKLDSAKARARLGWRPAIDVDEALCMTIAWYQAQRHGEDMLSLSVAHIDAQPHKG